VAKAEMADNGPVRGTMVIRPYGYAIWERMQAEIDQRIKAAGAQNAYFPLFIPQSYFEREAEHVEGFKPELAVVTYAGGEELAEPIVVRPTSETMVGEFMAKWIQSYRDLPLLLNQWANVVRWELRPRLFLRSSEFLWQEGHTAHASFDDAAAYARTIHADVYNDFLETVLAMPTHLGIKPASERFPGATNSMTAEGVMRDGKALQFVTSHEFGQNFSKVFDIFFQNEAGQAELCYTTSWGSSTRIVGGLIMAHGDDDGLVLPPRLAPTQIVVIAVRDEPDVNQACAGIVAALSAQGLRARSRPRQFRAARDRLGDQGRAAARRGRSARPGPGPGDAGAPRQRREADDLDRLAVHARRGAARDDPTANVRRGTALPRRAHARRGVARRGARGGPGRLRPPRLGPGGRDGRGSAEG
jgi:prolyl-tRNA synthetase